VIKQRKQRRTREEGKGNGGGHLAKRVWAEISAGKSRRIRLLIPLINTALPVFPFDIPFHPFPGIKQIRNHPESIGWTKARA